MKTLYLRILEPNGETLTQLAMKCWQRKCDKCSIVSKCSELSGIACNFVYIEVSHRWALRNLEYHEKGHHLVWKKSKAKKKKGEFAKTFFQPLWCKDKTKCDKCKHRFYCYTN